MKQRIIVAALVNRGDDYLFIRQNKVGGAYPGTLHIPGGGLEAGEAPEEAIRRELREETGMEIKNLRAVNFDHDLFDSYKGAPHQLVFLQFTAEYDRGKVTAGSDAEEVIWVPRDRLNEQPLNPATIRFLKALELLP